VLKSREVITLALGAMIGWSWVLMTGLWVQTAGSLGTLIAFAAGGLAIALIGLTYSELASALPRAGGEHVYTHRALGHRWSFVCTWALLFAYVNVCLFESIALPTAVEYLLPGIRMGTLWSVLGADVDVGFVIVGAGSALLVTVVNVLGIKAAARLQSAAIGLILLAGVILVSGAVVFGETDNARPWMINLQPARIGKLLIVSVLLAEARYGLIAFAVATALSKPELATSSMATGDAATALWGDPIAGRLLVLGGVAGILTSWNAFVIGGSRVMFALAESGSIPAIFARLHPRYRTPYVGVITIGVMCCFAPLFGRTVLVWLIDAGSFAVVVAYLFVPLAFLALRRQEPDLPRPFKVSHPRLVGVGAFVLAIGLLTAYLPGSPSALIWPYEWAIVLAWTIVGAVLFLAYGAKHPR
jgi:amino acid transporter